MKTQIERINKDNVNFNKDHLEKSIREEHAVIKREFQEKGVQNGKRNLPSENETIPPPNEKDIKNTYHSLVDRIGQEGEPVIPPEKPPVLPPLKVSPLLVESSAPASPPKLVKCSPSFQ